MKNSNSKTLAILLFCVVQISFGAKEPGFGNDLNKAASAGLFSTVNDISKVNSSSDGAAISSESLVIDTKNDTLTADGGVKFKYQGLKLQAFGFKRDKDSNIVTATGDVRIEMGDGSNQARIDSHKTLLSLDSSTLKYYDSISYMEVGTVTGAEAPNDRIYFGGEVGEYNEEAFTLKNAWFTTDFSILKTGDYKKGGYYLETKKLKIVPDNKAEFQDIDLYISGHKVGWFPWYAVNIRQGSKVPLFPVWGDKTDYGFHISSGINYGDNNSKYFKGGIAPKFADQLGLLIGRFENWYDLGDYGKGLITADDLLVSKKDNSIDDRWDLAANHEYKSDNGYLKLGLQSTTVNKISALEDYRDELERAGHYDPTSPNYDGKERNDGESINFITLDSEFKNIGEQNDITLHSKVKMLAGGEDAYRQLVDDRMDDASFGSQLDHKLYTDLGFTKDNDDYMISAYYDYLKDLDPGSTSKNDDDQSRRENFGFAFNLKEAKIDFAYDHESGDKLRKLRSWERSPDLEDIVKAQKGQSINYVPWSVYEYNKDNSDKVKLHLGEYDLGNSGATYKVKFDSLRSEKELNLDNDPFRFASGPDNNKNPEHNPYFNKRDQQYNKEENIIYNKNNEDKIATEFFYDQYRLELTFGKTKEESWDREGIYKYKELVENDAYNIYINESDFAQIELEDKRLNLGYLGQVGLKYNLRYDSYTSGYDSYNGNNDGGDSSLRHQFDFNHKVTLLDNTNNHFRDVDLKLNNEFNYFGQFYSYDNGSRNGDSTYNGQVRLKNKDSINEFQDKITLDLGNTTTIYTAGYKQSNDGFDRDIKKGDLFTNNIDFLVNDEKKLNLYYDLNKKYTRGELTPSGYTFDEEYNDLTNYKFGGSYYINENYRFYYNHEKIDYTLKSSQSSSSSKPNNTYSSANEKVSENTYGIEIKDDLDVYNITYTHGSDDRIDNDIDTFNVKNDIIGASYLNGGEVEHFYRATYGIYKYGPSQSLKNYSSDQVSFRYEYRDKRFTDEELKSYAAAEYNKDKLEITPTEISRVKQILNERNDNQLDFSLNSIMFEEMNRPEYKKYFTLSLMANINREAYNHSNDFFRSLKELEGDVYGSYKRFGLGYTYREEADFLNYERNITKQEHEFRMRAGIGKPSQGWNIKLSYKTELNDEDEYGIYLGKEMGYYEWSVGYTKDYDRNTKSYDDRLAVQFTLLTFPTNPLFGIGYKDKNGSMTPNLWLGSGVEVDEPKK